MSPSRTAFAFLLSALFALAAPEANAQCVSLTTLGSPSAQNFNTLSNTAASTTNNLTLTGWFMTETGGGTRDNEQYGVDTGGSGTGDTYSYGAAGNTERALGGLQSGTLIPVIGVCYTNNTGGTISSLDVAYTGEQWRIGNTAAARDDRLDFEYSLNATSLTTGTWTAVNTLDFTNPIKTAASVGALDGNLAANRTAIGQSIAALSIANGATFWIRWNDLNASGADDGLAVDDFSVTPQGAGPPPLPTLNISDVTLAEGDAPGTTTFTFAVTLTAPAGAGGVTFDIATADGTAQDDTPATEDNDYVAQSLTGQSIPMGSTGPYNFAVTVNRDGTTEPNETFFVNVTNITGANAGDAQGLGTITNDDVTVVFIHDVQGNAASSPIPGSTVTVRGIVTLLKSNGFFLQEEVSDNDADPNTSEGIFVFTSSAPTVAVGDQATVTGTVVEFNGLTEISPVTNVTINSTGNTLPTAVTLTPADLPPTASFAQPQLEKYESMRLLAPSLVTVAPNDDFFDVETVLTPQPRPFREPGIPASDPVPPDPTSGLPDCCIPIWDENPERLNVDTNGRAGSTGETLTSNVTLTNVTGPLDFSFSRYRLINEANLTRTADMSAVPVPVPAANEFTIAGYNIENFNNNAIQRQKAALTVRDVLQLPDIIGTIEIFDLADLQALATEIQTISGVTYSAHLIEQDGTSEDSDQDVGFLIKTSRVSVTSVTAEKTADTFINPNTGLPELLHDRPPLLLTGTVDPSGSSPLPVFVIVNHLRSFIDVELVAGEGPRVRAKRKAQAESLADLLNDLQTANPTTPVISVGDYNAFQFNSGYDDSISVLKGMPTPDDQIVVDQSPDLVNPDYSNLFENVPAAQRYSFIFEGTPQSLDHMLVNTAADALNTGIAVARVNADFPEVSAAVYASNAARPERNSDHDPVVGYFLIPASADVTLTKTLDTAGPYFVGQSITYTIVVANAGPDPATNVSVTDTPTNLTITGVSGACASLPCTIASIAAGADATITVTATITAAGAFDNSATATADENDPNTANNTDNTSNGGTAAASADVSITKTLDTAGPYYVGGTVSYTITVTNAGPSTATNIGVTDTPANLTITAVSGACTSFSPCTIASLASGANTNITVTATINAAGSFDNSATADADESDPNTGNNTDNTSNGGTAAAAANISVTKTLDTSSPYYAGASVTYTINVANAGPSTATSISVTDTPSNLTITNVSGACTSFSPCTIASLASGANTNITVTATITAAGAFDNSATATAAEHDPNTADNTDNTGNGGTATAQADVSLTKTLDTAGPWNVGQSITYTIVVSNSGPSTATTINVTDSPSNLTITGVSGACTSFSPCTIAALASGASTNITVTATIDSVGSFDNSATALAAENDPNTADNTDSTGNGGSTNAAADVTMNATLNNSSPYFAGSAVTFILDSGNSGPSTANNVQVTATLTNLNITSVSGSGCAALPCTIASINSGGNAQIFVNATIPAAGAFGIISTADADEFDPNASNNTDNDGDTATLSADVSVVKTLVTSAPHNVGQSITYTLDVANAGPSTATTVQVTDTPTNLTITGVSGGGCAALPCTIASIASGASVQITVTATINSVGAFDNSATASGTEPDPNMANNTDNTGNGGTTGNAADLSVSKLIITVGPYHQGDTVSFQTVVSNAGPNVATNIVVTDTPIGVPLVAGSISGAGCTSFPCTIPSLAVGASDTITYSGVIQNPGSFDNSTTISGAEFDPNTANNSDLFGNGGVAQNTVNVAITKTLDTPGPYVAGQSVTYTLVVSNTGPGVALFVVVSDAPTNLTITSVSGAGCAAFPCTLVPGVTPTPASNRTITVVATINAAGAFDNSATATPRASDYDPNLADNTDNTGNGGVASASADVSLVKTLTTNGPYTAGQTITYTLVVANAGPSTATTVQVTDTPTNLTITNVSGGGCAALPCTLASLASGANVTITVTATINTAGSFDNSANAAGVEGDPTLANNTDNTGNGGTTGAGGDADGDGVPDVIEQGAPNGGDGNGDGISDHIQSTVASLPAATGSGYLTLQSSCSLQEVYVTTESAMPVDDPGYQYPHGMIAFRAPCSSATFSLFVYGNGAVSSYRKYGPLPPGGPSQWYQLPGATFQVVTVGALQPQRIDFSLADGATGDDTVVDGVIVDQGGPAAPSTSIPTLDEWALIALAMAIAAFAALKLRS